VWARLLTCRLLGVPAPRYRGFPMFRYWWTRLSMMEKARTVLGTARRIVRRGLRSRIAIEPFRCEVEPARALSMDDFSPAVESVRKAA
jgi:coenzyme F420 hydrogenase subunit beta